jgi:hypothetical protein
MYGRARRAEVRPICNASARRARQLLTQVRYVSAPGIPARDRRWPPPRGGGAGGRRTPAGFLALSEKPSESRWFGAATDAEDEDEDEDGDESEGE